MKPENVTCPKCGGPMVPRESKFGRFWGCKKYPDCDGTRDSMGNSKEDREQSDVDDRTDEEIRSTWNRK